MGIGWKLFQHGSVMVITYIKHSGFLVELEHEYLLFDYYQGDLPQLDGVKRLTVFVSHEHYDHFNSDIFTLFSDYPNVQFVISSDVKLSKQVDLVVSPNEEIELNGLWIKTLTSTDQGVAFLVKVNDVCLYHAGDLHLWVFDDDTDEEQKQMHSNFSREINKLRDYFIDVAFLPLDPRLKEFAFGGVEEFVDKVNVKWLVPMHMWDNYELIKQYNACHEKQLVEITHENQKFEI